MKIVIDNEYSVQEDNGTSVALVKETLITVEKENEKYKVGDTYLKEERVAYCSDVPQAIKTYIKIKANKVDKTLSLKQWIDEYKELTKKVEDLIKGEMK
jgi:hypothetical protein